MYNLVLLCVGSFGLTAILKPIHTGLVFSESLYTPASSEVYWTMGYNYTHQQRDWKWCHSVTHKLSLDVGHPKNIWVYLGIIFLYQGLAIGIGMKIKTFAQNCETLITFLQNCILGIFGKIGIPTPLTATLTKLPSKCGPNCMISYYNCPNQQQLQGSIEICQINFTSA